MKRKVIKQGYNALTMTLPARWTKKHGLTNGNEIEVEELGKDLVIRTNAIQNAEKTEFDLKNFQIWKGGPFEQYPRNYYLRPLGALYRLGYDEVKINFDNPRIVDFIQQELDFLLGYEIVDQGEKHCILRNVASSLDKEFDTILRRCFLMMISMAKDSYDAIQKKEYDRLQSIARLERVNNRLTNFCERLLNKEGYKVYKKTAMMYTMIVLLEQSVDDLRAICQYIVANKDKKVSISENTLKFYREVISMIEDIYNLFYNFDKAKLYSFYKNRDYNVGIESIRLLESESKYDTIILHYLTSIMNKVYHMSESVIEA